MKVTSALEVHIQNPTINKMEKRRNGSTVQCTKEYYKQYSQANP